MKEYIAGEDIYPGDVLNVRQGKAYREYNKMWDDDISGNAIAIDGAKRGEMVDTVTPREDIIFQVEI